MVNRIAICAAVFWCAALLATDAPVPDKKVIQAVDDQYVNAFNSGDIESVTKMYSDDAVYVTDEGQTLKGRNEIKKAFEQQFKEMNGAQLSLKVYSIEFSPDKQRATERGVSFVTKDDINEPSSYIAEFILKDNQWLMSKVVESPEAATAEKLEPLSWMIGEWADNSEDATIVTKNEWSLDRAFITRKFDVSGEGRRSVKGIEYIGWDAAKKEIHSWYFDSAGGHGGGRWKFDGKSWIVDAAGVTPSGEIATGTHVFTPKDKNSFTWSTIHRRVGGESEPDVPEVTIQRSTQEQASAAREKL
jgi:uncharacterized protein (TIGR02246 family)